MSRSNTAFFHPSRQVQPGIRLHDLYHAESQQVRQGLLLGPKDRRTAFEHGDPNRQVPVEVARSGSTVVWCLDGHPLAGEDSILMQASIMRVKHDAERTEAFLASSFEDGNHLVLVRTGLRGKNVASQVEKHAAQGIPAMAHGVLALDDGATLIAAHAGMDTLSALDGLPAVTVALYELRPGSEIAVCDIYPGGEHRIVCGKDGIISLALPRAAISKLYEAMHLARYEQEREAA